MYRSSVIIGIWLLFASLSPAAPISFSDQIRPLLSKHCIACHGGVKKASALSFITLADATAAAKSGQFAMVPGDPTKSEMLRRIALPASSDDHMPPAEHGPGLSAEEQLLMTNWIAQGGKWEDHWAYIPPAAPAGGPHSVDSFVLAKLKDAGLSQEKEETKERLLRRLTLDLTGLPPSPTDTANFLADNDGTAYEKRVDALLASPSYGERWAALWLDLVRYADSKGLGQDRNRSMWQYRDWVVDALNADLPFDQFTKKQLAGDLLPGSGIADRIASACHRNTATNDEGGTDDEEFRIEAIHDRVSTTWQVWQGITFGCAQCHAHPYDPFTHQDYYHFFALFNQTADCDTNADHPLLNVPSNSKDWPLAASLDAKLHTLREEIHAPQIKAATQPNTWTYLRDLSPTSNKCSAKNQPAAERDEFLLTGTIPVNITLTVEAPIPAEIKTLAALRLHALPRDLEAGTKLSEWGFVLGDLTVDIISPQSKAPSQRVILKYAFCDEAEPTMAASESFAQAPAKPKKGEQEDPKKLVPTPDGWAAYTRIYKERWAVFAPETPVEITPGSRLRLVMHFPQGAEGAHPLAIKRGAIALSGQPVIQTLFTSPAFTKANATLEASLKQRSSLAGAKLPVMRELPAPLHRSTQLFVRGNWMTRGENTPAAFPKFMATAAQPQNIDRAALADWLTSPQNPLTARVLVNRLWEQLFGTGIVETLEDFGSSGEKPSHPELLDWMALRFQNDHRWSIKKMLRDLVLSATYRQQNTISPAKLTADPQNRLLSHGPRLRLTAEMIRDQALAVSGLLSPKLHGPSTFPPLPGGVWVPFLGDEKWPTAGKDSEDRYRRALYTHVKRSIPNPMSAAFDAPSREVCNQRRVTSNTPVQALTLLNDEVLQEAASALAAQMSQRASATKAPADGIALGYQQMLQRPIPPTTLKSLSALYTSLPEPDTAWVNIALVLLNLDETLVR